MREPRKYTVTDVADRFEQAAQTLHRLPRVGVQGYFNAMPEVIRTAAETLQEEKLPMRLGPPSAEAISKMEEVLANARLIDESALDTSKVLVHSTVKIKNQGNGMEMTYKLVAQSEADLKSGKISVDSPIGKGLLGKKVGETAEIQVPNGTMKFDILEIRRD